jgi:probable addiction module antidote protein
MRGPGSRRRLVHGNPGKHRVRTGGVCELKVDYGPGYAAGIARALGDFGRARGMAQVARDAGLSRESLYKALSEHGNPSFATVLKVARALGVRLNARVA